MRIIQKSAVYYALICGLYADYIRICDRLCDPLKFPIFVETLGRNDKRNRLDKKVKNDELNVDGHIGLTDVQM